MSTITNVQANRIHMVHDLMIELGRVEMLLEGGANLDENRISNLREKHGKLRKAVDRLVA